MSALGQKLTFRLLRLHVDLLLNNNLNVRGYHHRRADMARLGEADGVPVERGRH